MSEAPAMPNRRAPPARLSRPLIVIAVLLGVLVAVGLARRMGPPGGQPPAAAAVRTADLVAQDHDDGSITLREAGTGQVVDTVPPATNGFLRSVLSGLVRERRRERIGAESIPFHLTRWSDGRLTLDDVATGRLIELEAFGQTNEAAFARLLEATPPRP